MVNPDHIAQTWPYFGSKWLKSIPYFRPKRPCLQKIVFFVLVRGKARSSSEKSGAGPTRRSCAFHASRVSVYLSRELVLGDCTAV